MFDLDENFMSVWGYIRGSYYGMVLIGSQWFSRKWIFRLILWLPTIFQDFFENRILTVFMAANCAFAISLWHMGHKKNHLCTSVHVFTAVLAWFFASMEQPSAKSFLLWKCENLYYFYWFWSADAPPNFPEKIIKIEHLFTK